MDQTTSFCLDVFVDSELNRNNLLSFLHEIEPTFGKMTVQRGRMNGVKSLRIMTTQADDLIETIEDDVRVGLDYDYTIHDSAIDARRSFGFMADYNHPLGDEEFDIKDWKPA